MLLVLKSWENPIFFGQWVNGTTAYYYCGSSCSLLYCPLSILQQFCTNPKCPLQSACVLYCCWCKWWWWYGINNMILMRLWFYSLLLIYHCSINTLLLDSRDLATCCRRYEVWFVKYCSTQCISFQLLRITRTYCTWIYTRVFKVTCNVANRLDSLPLHWNGLVWCTSTRKHDYLAAFVAFID